MESVLSSGIGGLLAFSRYVDRSIVLTRLLLSEGRAACHRPCTRISPSMRRFVIVLAKNSHNLMCNCKPTSATAGNSFQCASKITR